MLLAVDIGNTNIVLGCVQDGQILRTLRLSTNRNCTSDELTLMLHQFFRMNSLVRERFAGSIVCSVAPSINPIFRVALKNSIGIEPTFLSDKENYGLKIMLDWREELGQDRIVNSYAAYHKYGEFCVVIDFGTATTFDVITDRGEYLGGVIATGLKGSAEALCQNTAKLPRIDLSPPSAVIGKNTVDSMKSGIVLGYSEMVSGLIRRIREELGLPFKVIATGGLARMMHDAQKEFDIIDDDLTLWGLNAIYEDWHRKQS